MRCFALLILTALLAGSVAVAAPVVKLQEPLRTADGELLTSIYYFGHWWDPWKSDDSAIEKDMLLLKSLGFNTICVDHEISQALDRNWYWLDREHRIAKKHGMWVVPWLQLTTADRVQLSEFAKVPLREPITQDGKPASGSLDFGDPNLPKALSSYAIAYLNRYLKTGSILQLRWNGKNRPVIALCVEAGDFPVFDSQTNTDFRNWLQRHYKSIWALNKAWGSKYSSFGEIDPVKAVDYHYQDCRNAPQPVQDHARFRAERVNSALEKAKMLVRSRYPDVLVAVEVAYPFYLLGVNDSGFYCWNHAMLPEVAEHADIVFIRTIANTATPDIRKHQDRLLAKGKKLVLGYRFFSDSFNERGTNFGFDAAVSANGIGYYSWNEMADFSSGMCKDKRWMSAARVMNSTYRLLYDPKYRHKLWFTAPAGEEPAGNQDAGVVSGSSE